MRLLNTSTLRLSEFTSDVPPYAILSHTWASDEVTFQDITLPDPNFPRNLDAKEGFAKIKACCAQACDDGFEYAWIDTCCIDKSSSAELSEAINSMFAWYRRAEVCYAHLADVTASQIRDAGKLEAFSQARWFTRGWTLQELLAPYIVEFFDSNWEKVATKAHDAVFISQITGIDYLALMGKNVHAYSVAQRMSWASGRQTSREEDTAYSLLGLFDVNMPLLYGEGPRAFYRLQKKIIKRTDDHSIFAWKAKAAQQLYRGLIANSVDEFAGLGQVRHAQTKFDAAKDALSFNSKGITLKMFIKREASETYLASLNCTNAETENFICIRLERVMPRKEMFSRVNSDTVIEVPPSEVANARIFDLKPICVVDPLQGRAKMERNHAFAELPTFCLSFTTSLPGRIATPECQPTDAYRLVRLKALHKADASETDSVLNESKTGQTSTPFAHFAPSNSGMWATGSTLEAATMSFELPGESQRTIFSFGLRIEEGRPWAKLSGLPGATPPSRSSEQAIITLSSGEGMSVAFRKRGACNNSTQPHFHGTIALHSAEEWNVLEPQLKVTPPDLFVGKRHLVGVNSFTEAHLPLSNSARHRYAGSPEALNASSASPFSSQPSRSPRHFAGSAPPPRKRFEHLHPYDRRHRHRDRDRVPRSPTFP